MTSRIWTLINILKSFNLGYHVYADDTQLYIPIKPENESVQVTNLDACINVIKCWMKTNFLKLNDDKTEFLRIGSHNYTSKISVNSLSIGDTSVTPTNSVRNLGVIFDKNMNMNDHISSICKATNHQLYKIGRIRNFLDLPTTKLLMNSLVTSRLDYCNSLLYNLPSYQINRLQKIQNKAARIVTKTRIHTHITPVLKELHWLPIQSRIEFKILTMTFCALYSDDFPQYIKELIQPYKPNRNLRSENKHLIKPVKANTSYGRRSLSFAAAELWNSKKFPIELKNSASIDSFKRDLKTYLFRNYFI